MIQSAPNSNWDDVCEPSNTQTLFYKRQIGIFPPVAYKQEGSLKNETMQYHLCVDSKRGWTSLLRFIEIWKTKSKKEKSLVNADTNGHWIGGGLLWYFSKFKTISAKII